MQPAGFREYSFGTPQSLKELARAKIPLPHASKISLASQIPFALAKNGNRANVRSLMGMPSLRGYAALPMICAPYKDVKVENARIAIVPFFMDNLGDIRIILDLRLMIRSQFDVEPLLITTKECQKQILNYLENSPEVNGLNFIDLETLSASDCQGLELLIHGPAVDSTESQKPENILLRYPKLKSALDSSNPPKIISLLESDSSSFSYSAPVDDYPRAFHMLQSSLPVYTPLIHELSTNTLNPRNKEMLKWMIPFYKAASEYIDPSINELPALFRRTATLYQAVLDNPYSMATIFNASRLGADVEKFVQKYERPLERLSTRETIFNVANAKFSAAIFSRNASSQIDLFNDVSELYELQLGLDPLFSMGCFKLPPDLLNWKKAKILDFADDRKLILENVKGPLSSEETGLLKGLLNCESYVFGYAHDTSLKQEFVKHTMYLNPSVTQFVINMSAEEALLAFPGFNVVDYNPNQSCFNNSTRTIHVYHKLGQNVFNAVMAAADPSCRLAGGDNTFYQMFMLGSDNLIYDLRGFKKGFLLALFKLANELNEQERNCIVDRMLARLLNSALPEDLKSYEKIFGKDYHGYQQRKATKTLSKPGTDVYISAFRKMGEIISRRAERFEETLTGFLKMQITKRREGIAPKSYP